VRLGETSSGIPVELNRALKEFDHVITVGAVTYHYFAGFTGGRKLVCPGLASSRTVSETHRLAFDFERGIRAKGVGIGKLAGNPVHEAFVEAASLAPPAFAVNTIVDAEGSATDLLCGDWLASHEEACDRYRSSHSKQIIEKRELVIASCGGSPYDINLIQAHKALETASYACQEGGTILLMAECPDGLGRPDFLEWFSSGTSDGIAAALTERYQVNGQTAWSLMDKSERFDVRMISELDDAVTEAMGMRRLGSVSWATFCVQPPRRSSSRAVLTYCLCLLPEHLLGFCRLRHRESGRQSIVASNSNKKGRLPRRPH